MDSTRPLRFCMITTFYPPYNFGGDGIFVQRLSNELARRGHRVDVIHSVDAYRLRGKEPAGGYDDHPNVTVHGLTSSIGLLSALATQQTGTPFFYSERLKQILQNEFDVIHYHNVSLVGGPQILKYGEGVKLYSIHEYWLVCPTHVLYRYNRATCTQPHCFLCGLTYARPPQWWRYSSLLRDSVQRVDAFLAPSQFAIDIHHRFGFQAPFVQMPLFVPSKEIAVRSDSALLYFLFVGRLEKLKGIHTLIPFFRDNPRARLLIVGEGSMGNELRALARNSGNIQFLGQMTDQQLQELYRNALAVIVPSLCYETFSNVVLEAFRQQTPVIARSLGALPEIVAESGGGLVYETDRELIAAMEELIENPSRRRNLGIRGYETYEQKWTANAYLERYFALIREIQRGKARAAAPREKGERGRDGE